MFVRKIVPMLAAAACLTLVAGTSLRSTRPTPGARKAVKHPSPGRARRDRISRELGKIEPLSGDAKIGLLAPLHVEVQLLDLNQPFSLNARQPYRDAANYLSIFDPVLVQPQANPPEVRLEPCTAAGCTSWAQVDFRALGAKTYLVDCSVAGSNTYDVILYDAGQRSEQTHTSPSGGHLTLAIPSRPQARNVSVMLMAPTPWAFTGCEMTPVG